MELLEDTTLIHSIYRAMCSFTVLGSLEPPKMLEIHYRPDSPRNSKPVAMIGKGITFDSGGISIKGAAGMAEMKADMSGTAVTAASIFGLAKLNVPIRIPRLKPRLVFISLRYHWIYSIV